MDFNAVMELAKQQLANRLESLIPSAIKAEEFIYGLQAIVTVLLLMSFAMNVFIILKDRERENRIYNLKPRRKKEGNFLKDVILKELSQNVNEICNEKGKTQEDADRVFLYCVAFCVGMGLFMLLVKQLLLALILPVILLFVLSKVTGMMKTSFDDYVQKQLPFALDNMIRIFTKTSDLRLVMYETSKATPSPMKSFFETMGRRMINESPTMVLRDTQATAKNIWIHNLLFILMSMEQDARKEDVIQNLRELRDIIDRENKARKAEATERKLTVAVNYTLCVIALIFFVANVIFNPEGIDFFFSTLAGLACFIVGIILITISVFSNLMLTHGKR